MSVRKISAVLAAVAATGALTAAALVPANAEPPAGTVPRANDIVGVGSDTIQYVDQALADAYNQTVGPNDPKVISYDACTTPDPGSLLSYPCTNSGSVALAGGGSMARPGGSGPGRAALYNDPQNSAKVAFGRASGVGNATDFQNGLVGVPFALDTVVVAVSLKNTAAPESLTDAQVLGIYTGQYDNWSQVGGKDAPIDALEPQSGSGTRSFFEGQLKSINGGTAPTLVAKDTYTATDGSTQQVYEHDPAPLVADSDAIAPFSKGRASFASDRIRVVGGFAKDRAVWNYVRQTKIEGVDAPDEWLYDSDLMQSVFGPDGFWCSPAARPIIEEQGFRQFKSGSDGPCGLPLTSDVSPTQLAQAYPQSVASFTATGPATVKGSKKFTIEVASDNRILKPVQVKLGGKLLATQNLSQSGTAMLKVSASKLKTGTNKLKVALDGVTKTVKVVKTKKKHHK